MQPKYFYNCLGIFLIIRFGGGRTVQQWSKDEKRPFLYPKSDVDAGQNNRKMFPRIAKTKVNKKDNLFTNSDVNVTKDTSRYERNKESHNEVNLQRYRRSARGKNNFSKRINRRRTARYRQRFSNLTKNQRTSSRFTRTRVSFGSNFNYGKGCFTLK